MSVVTERIELLITSTARGVANEVKGVGTELETGAQKAGRFQGALGNLGVSGASAGQMAGAGIAAGVAVGGAALAKFVDDGIEKFASLTSEVRGFQRVAGTTAEDSSRLVFAVKQLGIDPDTAASAFGRLSTRIGTGKADLEQFGVQVAHNKDGTVDLAGTVANLSEKYQSTEDPTLRAAVANEAFGKSWQKLSPLLGKGKEDLQAIYAEAAKDHQLFSDADLEKGREFSAATRELSATLQGLEVEVGSAVIPAVTSLTRGLTSGVQSADSLTGSIGGIGGVLEFGLNASPVGNFSLAMKGASDIVHGDFVPGIGEAALSVVPLGGAIADLTGLFDTGGDSATSYADKQNAVKDALTKVADLTAQGKQGTQEYKDAVKAARDASDEYSKSNKGVSDSLQTVADKAYAAQQGVLAQANAQLAAQGALIGVDAALDSQGDKYLEVAQAAYQNQVAQQAAADAGGNDAAANQAAADAAENLSDKKRDLDQANLSAVGSVTAYIAKAQEVAAQQLGPGADAHDVEIAKTKAGREAYEALIAKFPDLKGQIEGYIGLINTTPQQVRTQFVADMKQAQDAAIATQQMLDALDGRRVRSYVEIQYQSYGNPFK